MKRTPRAVAVVLVVATLTAAPPADAAAPLRPEARVSGGPGTVVTDASGNALAVAGRALETAQVHFRYRHVGGRWSAQYAVPGLGGSYRAAASGRVDMPLVVGSAKGSDRGVAAVIRRTNATWTPALRLDAGLAGSATGVDAAGNADGDFAVSWTQFPAGSDTGTSYVSVRLRGGTWHRYVVGGLSDVSFTDPNAYDTPPRTRVGIDSYGNVTVARTVTSAGSSTHRLLTRRKPVSGAWEAQHQVSSSSESVRWHDLVIEPTGRQTVAYQTLTLTGPNLDIEFDTYVLRQATVGGPLGQVWRRSASERPAIAAAGGRLRVVWSTTTDLAPPIGHTQAFNPAAQPVRNLVDGMVFPDVVIDKYGRGVLVTGTPGSVGQDVYLVSATGVRAGPKILGTGDEDVAVHPALGAGSQYFVGVDTRTLLPGGGDYISQLQVFRAARP